MAKPIQRNPNRLTRTTLREYEPAVNPVLLEIGFAQTELVNAHLKFGLRI